MRLPHPFALFSAKTAHPLMPISHAHPFALFAGTTVRPFHAHPFALFAVVSTHPLHYALIGLFVSVYLAHALAPSFCFDFSQSGPSSHHALNGLTSRHILYMCLPHPLLCFLKPSKNCFSSHPPSHPLPCTQLIHFTDNTKISIPNTTE